MLLYCLIKSTNNNIFGGFRRGNYFGGGPSGRTEVEMKKLKNGKTAGKDEIIGDTIEGGVSYCFIVLGN